MAHIPTNKSSREWHAYIIPLVLAFLWIVLVVSLGCIGFRDTSPLVSDRIYFALQLLFLGGSHFPDHMSWQLQVARFLAPAGVLVTLVLGILVVTFLSVDQVRLWALWCIPWRKKHVLVCGLGRKGFQLVSDYRSRGHPVLVIDKDDRNPLIPDCDRLGAVVLIGDAAKLTTMRKAHIGGAHCIVATCGDDGANMAIALHADDLMMRLGFIRRLLRRISGRTGSLPCYVHIVDLELRTQFRRHRMPHPRRTQVKIFNVYENSARLLFRSHFMDYQNPILRQDDPRQAHLVVFGFGQLGASVVLQAVKMAHFPNGKQLRVTVIDKDAERRHNRFLTHYGSFHNLCEAKFIEIDAEEPAILDQVAQWCEEPNSIVTLAVCFDSDSHSLSFGLTLRNGIGLSQCPILVRMESHAGLATLFPDVKECSKGSVPMSNIQGFAKIEEASSYEVVADDTLNTFARKIHKEFVSKRVKDGRSPEDPSMKSWEELDPDLKDSNWQEAEHLQLKLRAINSCPEKISDEDAEKLAKMEHSRWITERSLAGWRMGLVKDLDRRIHPDLKPWQELENAVQEYDREVVKLIPELDRLDKQMNLL